LIQCGSIVEEDRELLKDIDNWDFTKIINTKSFIPQLGPSIQWTDAWANTDKEIKKKEKENAIIKLRLNTGADQIVNVNVETQISSIQYSMIYMPVYYYTYSFEEKNYKFFINGQNGERTGQRPFGLGTLGKGIDQITNFTKSIFNRPNPKLLEEWKRLNKKN